MKSLRRRASLALVAAVGSVGLVGIGVSMSPASAHPSTTNNTPAAGTTTTANPHIFTQGDPNQEGVRINGSSGGGITQLFSVYDYLNQPIAGVNNHGGMWVMGDDFCVYAPGNVFNCHVLITPFFPPTTNCAYLNQLRIGDPNGAIRRCVDVDAGAPVVLEWRRVL